MSKEYIRQVFSFNAEYPFPPILLYERWANLSTFSTSHVVGTTGFGRSVSRILTNPVALQLDLPSEAAGGDFEFKIRPPVPKTLALSLLTNFYAKFSDEIWYIEIRFSMAGPNAGASAKFKFDFINQVVQYTNSAGVYTTAVGPNLYIENDIWASIFLSLSLGTHRYFTCSFNDIEYDVLNKAIKDDGTEDKNTFTLTIRVKAADDTATSVFLNSLILREL